ncbi:MAG: MoaD/ThiS family protein [bacterium]
MKVKVELRVLSIDDKLEIELKEGSTVESLLENLISIYGENLKKLITDAEKGFRIIVVANQEILKLDQELKDKDKLLLLLPVAGG